MRAICLDDKSIGRFWKYVNNGPEDECWEWKGAKATFGYGVLKIHGHLFLASRISWTIRFGAPGEMCVLHKCDNPPCVNPNHLFLGTKSDNSKDMYSKGRGVIIDNRGEKSGHAKLTWNDVYAIRRDFSSSNSVKALANRYGVSIGTIIGVVTNRHWIDLSYTPPSRSKRTRLTIK